MEHFNQLSPAEAERLAILLEEMGEVQQVIGKILRHGYESSNPLIDLSTTNRELLERELGDVKFSIEQLIMNDDISEKEVSKWEYDKMLKVHRFTHHQLKGEK